MWCYVPYGQSMLRRRLRYLMPQRRMLPSTSHLFRNNLLSARVSIRSKVLWANILLFCGYVGAALLFEGITRAG